MNRRKFLKTSGSAAILSVPPRGIWAKGGFRRRRTSDAGWPSQADWKRLHAAVGGNLLRVNSPLAAFKADPGSAAAKEYLANIRNPYYIGDHPGLTQTLGWVDAWASQPSVYAVAATNAQDIAAAVQFAREHDLRLVVKGGGHSYQGTSNAPDSLLIWTRRMHDVTLLPAFVPQGCEGKVAPQPAAAAGAGTIWMQAYDAVTTRGGRYVQGGGCTTVGVAGLIQSGGFGNFSKHFGTAAAGLLEAEVVTADGEIRIANACTNSDLFWALKGGGGGTFGVISRVTLRTNELPEWGGGAFFTVKGASDDSYHELVRAFVSFYRDNLFNDHWGESVHFRADNTLEISMVAQGLDTAETRKVWQPFLDFVAHSPQKYTLAGDQVIGSMPARAWWDVEWRKEHHQQVFKSDSRPGASPNNVWWTGDGGQVSWFIWAYESQWLPASLLESDSQGKLAEALYEGSRHTEIELHFNKGLAGAPPEALERSRDTATNPAVLDAFALAIIGDGQGPAYPGVAGHEPDVAEGRRAAARVHAATNELRAVAPIPAAYVSESNYFEKGWQQSYWGPNHARLAVIKKKYDPDGMFFVHNGVGSEEWSTDGFVKL